MATGDDMYLIDGEKMWQGLEISPNLFVLEVCLLEIDHQIIQSCSLQVPASSHQVYHISKPCGGCILDKDGHVHNPQGCKVMEDSSSMCTACNIE